MCLIWPLMIKILMFKFHTIVSFHFLFGMNFKLKMHVFRQ